MSSQTSEGRVEQAGPEIPTEHPHVIRRPGTCGGAPLIRGTRITVRHLALLHQEGASVEDMLKAFPHLEPSWVHDALSYYLDHREEIQREIEANRIDSVLARTGGVMDEKGAIRFPAQGAADG
jgi:uncharacterized protein (DUF433 family)